MKKKELFLHLTHKLELILKELGDDASAQVMRWPFGLMRGKQDWIGILELKFGTNLPHEQNSIQHVIDSQILDSAQKKKLYDQKMI